MARQILRIRDLGQSTFWQLMQMEGQPAPLTGKTALLLAADGADTQDVLAATAAARQLGMDVDMLPPALWAQDMASCDLQAPLYAHAGLCLTAGLKGGALDCLAAGLPGAVVNAGNDKGAPGQALADLALLAARHGDWESLRISWLGGAQCGLACDLITAAIYAPFELFMALPEWGEPDHSLLDMALRAGAKIFLSRDPELVLENAHAVYMGHGPEQCAAAPLTSGWPLTDELLALAAEDAAVLCWHGLAPADRASDTALRRAAAFWPERLAARRLMEARLYALACDSL